MIILDVEEQKKTVFELNEIEPFEEEMTFYYDESGNCRKFYRKFLLNGLLKEVPLYEYGKFRPL